MINDVVSATKVDTYIFVSYSKNCYIQLRPTQTTIRINHWLFGSISTVFLWVAAAQSVTDGFYQKETVKQESLNCLGLTENVSLTSAQSAWIVQCSSSVVPRPLWQRGPLCLPC